MLLCGRLREHGGGVQLSALPSGPVGGAAGWDRTGLRQDAQTGQTHSSEVRAEVGEGLIVDAVPQECLDVDECVELPDACVSNSVCVNTVVSPDAAAGRRPLLDAADPPPALRVPTSVEDANLVSLVTRRQAACPGSLAPR